MTLDIGRVSDFKNACFALTKVPAKSVERRDHRMVCGANTHDPDCARPVARFRFVRQKGGGLGVEKSDPAVYTPRTTNKSSANAEMDGAPARSVPAQVQISRGLFAIVF